MKRIILIAISTIILMFLIIPTVANAAEERKDYSVTILPGDGKIKANKDEFSYNVDTREPYVSCPKEGFEDAYSINVKVRENENIKNKIDYDRSMNTNMWGGTTFNPWDDVGYITDTRMVDFILEKGIHTGVKYYETEFEDIAYSKSCRKIYLFIPPENMNFSHFVDQDGNAFNIGDTVTKDLVLTPVYVEEEVETTFMNKRVHNVTFLKGEGEIYSSEGEEPLDRFIVQTYSGETKFYDISSKYAKFKYSDYEKGIVALEERKKISSRCSRKRRYKWSNR